MKVIHQLGLDVHDDSIAISIARQLSGFVWPITREDSESLMEAVAQRVKTQPQKMTRESS